MDNHAVTIENAATVSPRSKFKDFVPGGGGFHPGATGFVVKFWDINNVRTGTIAVSNLVASCRYKKEPLREAKIPYTRWYKDGGAPGIFFAYVVPTSHLIARRWDVDYSVMKPGAYEWVFDYRLNGKEYTATQTVIYVYNKADLPSGSRRSP